MRHLVLFFIAAVATGFACSSSSNSSSSSADDCSAHSVKKVDATTCTTTSVVGICVRSLGENSATSETVCAAGPDGTMYLIAVNGDTYLSGDGWTFGPREFGSAGTNTYAVEPDSLSAADEARCNTATSVCSSGSPIEAGAGGDAANDH